MAESNQQKTERQTVAPSPESADQFVLEKSYPDAANVFLPHTPKPITDKGVLVILDANAMLLPYDVNPGNLKALSDVFSRLADEDRLFVPARAAREFARHRDSKLGSLIDFLTNLKSGVPNAEMPPLLQDTSAFSAWKTSYEAVKKAHAEYKKAIDAIIDLVKAWRGDDPVAQVYTRILAKRVIDLDAGAAEKTKVLEELRYRYANHIPPGYKDADKEDDGLGDFLIWKTLLQLGNQKKCDLAFVTGEQKPDWFVRRGNVPVYPRYELIDEYRRASGGRTLRLLSLHELLSEMNAPASVVADVRTAETDAERSRAQARLTMEVLPEMWAALKEIQERGPSTRTQWILNELFSTASAKPAESASISKETELRWDPKTEKIVLGPVEDKKERL